MISPQDGWQNNDPCQWFSQLFVCLNTCDAIRRQNRIPSSFLFPEVDAVRLRNSQRRKGLVKNMVVLHKTGWDNIQKKYQGGKRGIGKKEQNTEKKTDDVCFLHLNVTIPEPSKQCQLKPFRNHLAPLIKAKRKVPCLIFWEREWCQIWKMA